jgi:hypothetical protein
MKLDVGENETIAPSAEPLWAALTDPELLAPCNGEPR